MTSCKHCREEIVPCPTPSAALFCGGWKHVRFIGSKPIGSHYCGGRSINPLAEPDLPESANDIVSLPEPGEGR